MIKATTTTVFCSLNLVTILLVTNLYIIIVQWVNRVMLGGSNQHKRGIWYTSHTINASTRPIHQLLCTKHAQGSLGETNQMMAELRICKLDSDST